MTNEDVIKAWRNRGSLADETPADPAGTLMLEDRILEHAAGASTEYVFTVGCCSGLTHVPSTCTCTWGSSCWPDTSVACSTAYCTG